MRQLTLFNDIILPPRIEHDEAQELLSRLHERGAVIGTDEAGRGALAGPVVAAAVYLTPEQEHELTQRKLRDSKKLTPKGREKLFVLMNELGVLWRAYMGSVDMVDRDNILRASLWTMGQCVSRAAAKLNDNISCVIVDGTERIPGLAFPQWTLIRADDVIPVVSAASIAAKVIRDRLMIRLDDKYRGYNFAKNKGYPTKLHMEAVRTMGMSEIHRRTFCRKIIMEEKS